MQSVSPSLVSRFRTLLRQRSKPRSFRRFLHAESLENRLALTAGTGIEVVADDASLSQYLAQTQEMGPVAPPAPDAPINTAAPVDSLDAQAVDAAITAGLTSDPAAEGEDVPPTILSFQVTRSGGWVYASGQIADDDPLNSWVSINGVQFWAEIAGVDSNGFFSLARVDEGCVGEVTAWAYDFNGNGSERVSAWLG